MAADYYVVPNGPEWMREMAADLAGMKAAKAAPRDPLGVLPLPSPPKPATMAPPEADVVVQATLSGELHDRYRTLVSQLGLSQPGLAVDRARAYFSEKGVRCYDQQKVHAYLNVQYGATGYGRGYGAIWGWRGLRKLDLYDGSVHIHLGNGQLLPGQYTKPVPLPVLLRVKEVVTAFPQAKCYVNDNVGPNDVRDPFLRVDIETEVFIIERWDEPAYRE